MAEIFGFKIEPSVPNTTPIESFAPPTNEDGALSIAATGGVFGTYVDLDGTIKNEAELISKYRNMALYPEVDIAIDDIVNEAITNNPDEPQVKLVLDDLDQPDTIKKMMEKEFDNILNLFNFKQSAYEIFRKWYIDGRIHYHIIIDNENPGAGIRELRYIDALKIKKVREMEKKRAKGTKELAVQQVKAEYYVYSEKGFAATNKANVINDTDIKGIKIAKDSIAHVTSGLTNASNDMVLSYLHKAIRPLNQLRNIEDSLVIYRISRAPERRVFYIDVGNLPKAKAEQYMRDMMTRFRNKIVYDSSTGEIKDDRKFMNMLEDFWLPRRGEGQGTSIDTLQGGQNLGSLEDVNYFQQKLYNSLNIPVTRLDPQNLNNLGRATEISRDEIKFQKFIGRLRLRFQNLFTICLGKQLILKGIITEEDWKEFQSKIDYRYSQDNYFAELKEIEIMTERLNLLGMAETYAGKYYSHDYIRKNILRQTDQEISDEDKKIDQEMKDPKYLGSFQNQFDAANQQQGYEDQQQQYQDSQEQQDYDRQQAEDDKQYDREMDKKELAIKAKAATKKSK